jgi:glycosyltransferase involved in cell wall biosynthesis
MTGTKLNTLSYRPAITPLPSGGVRPLWSVMIPSYNCVHFLRETLQTVLAQAPSPEIMQIEVVDDCSTQDDPQAVVAELGRGRVSFFRQPQNVGHSRNFNTCLERSRGRLIHLLHGDDWVANGFYEKMEALFEQHPEIGAGFCRHVITDDSGHPQRCSPVELEVAGVLPGWLDRIGAELPLQPPSMVVRRSVYEQLGGFDTRMLSCGEDWEMWVRVAAHYPVGFEPQILAFYRDTAVSLTKRSIRSGQNIRDGRTAARIMRTYLPSTALKANRKGRESVAMWGLHWARLLLEKREYRAALVQLREALRCSLSPAVLWRMARVAKFGTRQCLSRLRAKL